MKEQESSIDVVVSTIAALAENDKGSGSGLESSEDFGRYVGLPVDLRLLDGGRDAELLSELTYFLPAVRGKTEWRVPAGTTVNGASIPKPFWSLIGGPWSGRYREATIVHDHYCETQSRPWKDTHRAFYDAMRCSEVSAFKAKIMFYAVYRFGPRWSIENRSALESDIVSRKWIASADPASIQTDAMAIFEGSLSLAEIEALVDEK